MEAMKLIRSEQALRLQPASLAVVAASPTAMRAAAMRTAAAVWRATAVGSPHCEMRGAAAVWATSHPTAAMRGAHREMGCAAAMWTAAAVNCRASVERRSAMGCGRAMEPRTAAECRFPVGCSSTSMDRSRRAETPGSTAGGPVPGRPGAGRRRHGRSPG